MPAPRSEKSLTHSAEDILTQLIYQILACYPDGNDAQLLRNDTQRGNVPERPIGGLKIGLRMDRLSSHRFPANDHKLMTHVLAYLLYALFREANAETPELNRLEVGTTRVRPFKVGAVVQSTHHRIWFKVASHWPGSKLLTQAVKAVKSYTHDLLELWRSQNLFAEPDVETGQSVPFGREWLDNNKCHIDFV